MQAGPARSRVSGSLSVRWGQEGAVALRRVARVCAFARACISIGYDPAGTWWADVHRGATGRHHEVHYGGSVLGEVIYVADTLARAGDPSVLAHTGPDGRSLAGWMRMWAGIATGHLDGPPGLRSRQDMHAAAPVWLYLWPAHRYAADPLVDDALALPLPRTVQPNGAATVWEGPSGSCPACCSCTRRSARDRPGVPTHRLHPDGDPPRQAGLRRL